jgi:hypothetical protein
MKVIATRRGFYGGKVREEGEKFSIAKREDLGSWMDKVGAADPLDHDEDGKKGGSVPSGKPSAAERIAQAKELTGRDDIKTAKEADAILAAAAGEPVADEPAPFSDDTPIEAVED